MSSPTLRPTSRGLVPATHDERMPAPSHASTISTQCAWCGGSHPIVHCFELQTQRARVEARRAEGA